MQHCPHRNAKPSLAAAPWALVEPCRHNKDQNLIHAAALRGKRYFLSCALKDDGTNGGGDRQRLAFFALMLKARTGKDTKLRTPLSLAITSRRDPAVKELLKCLQLLFSQKYSLPFTPHNEAREIHLQEHFDIGEVCLALECTPDLAISFVSQLIFVTTGDERKVQEDVEKFYFGRHFSRLLIAGSKTRSPPGHWKTEIENLGGEVDHAIGEPVTAKICPKASPFVTLSSSSL